MSTVPQSPRADGAPRCRVSVIIKAFNEEKNICAAIESSLAAVAEMGGEVILADSHSTDRTVELASRISRPRGAAAASARALLRRRPAAGVPALARRVPVHPGRRHANAAGLPAARH